MKNLIFLAILGVAGYFGFQYYTDFVEQSSATAEPTSYEELPPIPSECEGKGRNMGDAIYGNDIGRVSFSQLNHATRSFQTCLKNAGISDADINGHYDKIKEEVMGLNPGSSKGF